jgi:hypothetical protein
MLQFFRKKNIAHQSRKRTFTFIALLGFKHPKTRGSSTRPSTHACTGGRPAAEHSPHRISFGSLGVFETLGFSGANPFQRHQSRWTPRNSRWQLDLSTGSETPSSAQQKAAHLPLTWPRCQVLVTLFAKYFSSFVRTTCALSVSGRYLALAEIYLPLRAAVPISTTRREAGSPTQDEDGTGVSPSLPGFPENFVLA